MDADEAVSTAVAALADREYADAAEAYARAGWATLAQPRPGQGPFEDDERGWVGEALRSFATGAVADRVAGRDERASRRAVEGVAVARDLADALGHPAQAACLAEFVADFRVVGDLDGIEGAYAAATEEYADASPAIDQPRDWATTPLFEAAAATIKQVARGPADGEVAIEWHDLHGADPADPGAFLAQRVTYKRSRFPALIERAVSERHLAAPRGTTEFATGRYRCPNCGADDVNWVADAVLCLRCSTPTERV